MTSNICKVRESNLELLRLIAMAMVVLHHANFVSLGIPSIQEFNISPTSTAIRIVLESMCLVCVNLFVLISGWFGIKLSLRGVCNILYTVGFYLYGIAIIFIILSQTQITPINIDNVRLFHCCFPLMGSNWYVLQYLLLMLVSPMLNLFVSNTTKKQLSSFLLVSLGFSVYCGYIWHNYPFRSGYNFLHMSMMYLLARYLKTYCYEKINAIKKSQLFGLYVLLTLTYACFIFFWFVKSRHEFPDCFAYNNPLIIVSSVSIFLFFSKFSWRNSFVNKMAVSCLAILLIHMHPLIQEYFVAYNRYIIDSGYHWGIILEVFVLFFFAITVDRLRILSFDFIFNKVNKANKFYKK